MHLILDLGHQPLCDTLLTPEALNLPEITYPLRMMWCADCTAAQLDYWEHALAIFKPNLGRFLRGEPLENVVDKHGGY